MEQDKKKLAWMFAALAIAVIGLMVYLVLTQFGGPKTLVEETVTATIPDGEIQKMTASKSEAFRGTISTDAYFDMLGEQCVDDDEISLVSDSLKTTKKSTPAPVQQGSAVERVFGSAPPDAPSQPTPPTRSSSRPMTREEKLEYDRQRAEMVRDVLTGNQEETPSQEGSDETPEPKSIDLSAIGSSDGIISSLDDDFEDAAVQYEGSKRPFRCMFVRDQKLTSGQRVTLRLLEDYNQDGVRIPANTHLAAICKIGDRLELQVRSLEINGRIIPLALDAYDTDGLQGIYCPETSSQKNSRTATNDAISTAGTTFGGLVGDIASTVIRTGATIAKSASGEVSVSVVSGYEFYLVKAERR
jgi:hypothetical protein